MAETSNQAGPLMQPSNQETEQLIDILQTSALRHLEDDPYAIEGDEVGHFLERLHELDRSPRLR